MGPRAYIYISGMQTTLFCYVWVWITGGASWRNALYQLPLAKRKRPRAACERAFSESGVLLLLLLLITWQFVVGAGGLWPATRETGRRYGGIGYPIRPWKLYCESSPSLDKRVKLL